MGFVSNVLCIFFFNSIIFFPVVGSLVCFVVSGLWWFVGVVFFFGFRWW